MAKPSLQEQFFKVREDAIVASVNRLLAEKGFDLMTVEEVAADVGIAKASLYKHFRSKEDLAAAAMARVLEDAIAFAALVAADPASSDLERLKEMARWAIRRLMAGEMPSLPAQNSSLRETLIAQRTYMDRLVTLSDQLGAWIDSARAAGKLDSRLPPEVALYTIFAKGCDPVVGALKAGGQHADDDIVEWITETCFSGLCGRAG